MRSNGWTFLASHYDMEWSKGRCGTDGWFGLHAGHQVGSVSVQFQGSGNATLTFGNCWHAQDYSVKAFLNGNEKAEAKGNEFKTVSFLFRKGDTLKITEDGAIIKLKSLIISCH